MVSTQRHPNRAYGFAKSNYLLGFDRRRQRDEDGGGKETRPRSQSSFTDWTRSMANRFWAYASFTPPPSPTHSMELRDEEPKYVLVDRASVVSSSAASLCGDTLSSVPIPSFRRAARPPRVKTRTKPDEDMSEEACHDRHKTMERMEHRELKRERELDQYSAYMEKLRHDFPSLFNAQMDSGYRRKRRRNTE